MMTNSTVSDSLPAATTEQPSIVARATCARPDAASAEPSVTFSGNSDSDLSTAKLLVVDDEQVNLLLARKCLQTAGYTHVNGCKDSTEVLATINDDRPDVVLLDIVMPEKSGLDVLREIRTDPQFSKLPVIVLTASDDDQIRAQALELGATDLIAKPFRPTELLPRVRNAILLKRQDDAMRRYTQDLERQVRSRTAELASSRLELIYCLARIAEYRDNESGRHVIRVGLYSGTIARRLGLDPTVVELIEAAAPLHDIGKIGVPDSILLKPGALTPEEVELMQTHVTLGEKAFEPMSDVEWKALRSHTLVGEMIMSLPASPLISMASQIALTHHELWNGAGYPLGLAGNDIPISGRIVAVADVFDALSSRRPYRQALPMSDCFEAIESKSGTQFDPEVVAAFVASREEIIQTRIEYADIE